MKFSTHMVPGDIRDFAQLIEQGGRLADQRHFAEARGYFIEALRSARAVHDDAKVGHALRALAKFYRKSSQPLQAVACYRQAGAHLPEGSLEWAHMHMGLGATYYEMDRPAEAVPYLKAAVAVFEAEDQDGYLSPALVSLGTALVDAGDPGAARAYLESAIQRLFASKNLRWLAYAYTELAKVELEAGRPRAALDQARLAMDLATERRDPGELGRALIVAGRAYAAQDQLTKGLRYLNEAVNLLTQERAWSDVLRATTLKRDLENRLIKE